MSLIDSVSRTTSCPPMRAVPSVGSRIPQSIRITVDLPEPFGPRNPKIDPLPTLNETWSTAVNVPKRLVRPSHSFIASILLFRGERGISHSMDSHTIDSQCDRFVCVRSLTSVRDDTHVETFHLTFGK